jgi:hypothetical protein
MPSFPQQFFAVSAALPDHRVLLAGGMHPMSGSRSAYRASLACYDYAAGDVVWLSEQTKSYPFRAVAHAGGAAAALRPENFVRCPKGLFRFDLTTGDPLPPDCELQGWKIDHVDASAGTFFVSWVHDDTSRVRAVDAHGGAFRERSFPYHSTSAGKTIERVLATSPDAFVAQFSYVKGRRIERSMESWTLESAAPRWQRRTRLTRMARNDAALLLWDWLGPTLDVEILALDTGELQASFCLPLADVMSLHPLDAHTWAALSISGVYRLDTIARTVSPFLTFGPDDFLDFGDLAIDPSSGKLIYITAGNHRRPGTRVMALDL